MPKTKRRKDIPPDPKEWVRTITGPGSFRVSEIYMDSGSTLDIDNTNGPVTIYVTGGVFFGSGATVLTRHHDPEQFAIYVASDRLVKFSGGAVSPFYGVIYAPESRVSVDGHASFFGAFVADEMTMSGQGRVHYYSPLRGEHLHATPTLAAPDSSADGGTATTDAPKSTETTATSEPAPSTETVKGRGRGRTK